MSRPKDQGEVERLRRSVAELTTQIASLADQVKRLCEVDNPEDSPKDFAPEAPSQPIPSPIKCPAVTFTKDGRPLPGPPNPAPEDANDLKIIWNRGRIVGAWWTRNCKPIARITVPDEANDFHFEGLFAAPARTLRKGNSGDDVRRLQEDLAWLGHESVKLTGVFDDATEIAVCSIQHSRGLDTNGIVDSTTRDAIGTIVTETIDAEMTPLTANDIQSLTQTMAALLSQDKGPEGPNHSAWRDRLQRAFAQRLREEGFTEHEIEDIILDSLLGIYGIIRNLWRLRKALRAFKKARNDAGPEPAWEE